MQGTVGKEINFFYSSPQPLLGSIVPVVHTVIKANSNSSPRKSVEKRVFGLYSINYQDWYLYAEFHENHLHVWHSPWLHRLLWAGTPTTHQLMFLHAEHWDGLFAIQACFRWWLIILCYGHERIRHRWDKKFLKEDHLSQLNVPLISDYVMYW